MSEVQKPVEEPVVAPTATEAPVVEESKAAENAPAEPASTETPAAVEAPVEETPAVAAPAKEEVKPVEDGVLGYKGPGLIKSFIFQKKFFWFGSEPVESKHLSSYLRGEKPEVANHNAAWSSHTGKGLLFFSKKASDKSSPAGVLNLSDATDVTEEGTVDFFLKIGEHKHTFQSTTLAERDSWVSVLKVKVAEAKELAESVTGSEKYKKTHSLLSPTVAAVGLPKKSTEVKKEEKKEDKVEAKEEKKEEKKEIKEEKKEEKKARKSRSASRKRNSIFGGIGFGKKEEKAEAKEETPVAATPAVKKPVAAEAAPVEAAPVVAEPVVAAPAVEETKTDAARPVPTTKRNSILGSIVSSFTNKEKKSETEAAPAVPAKDAEPVAENAPVIPAVETSEPLATSVASPATVPTETTTAPVTNGETKTETPVVKSDKRKSSLPWLTKKEKATISDEEGEKPKSPFAKLRGTLKSKASPKSEKAPEKAVETPAAESTKEETPVATEAAPVATEPVLSEPVSAAHTSTPQVVASA